MAEENEKKDSSVVGKANSVYRSYKNAKRAYNTVKAARTGMMAAEGISAAATSEVWVPVVIVGLIIVVIVIILFGGVSGVKGGDLSNSAPPTGSAVQPMPVNEIAKYFVITGATEAQKQIIYKMFSVPMGSAKYFSLLTSKGTIYINFIYRRGNVIDGGAFFGDGKTMQFTSFFESGISYDMKAHILIHESIHIIQQRQGNLGFNLQQLMSQDGNNCYDNGWIKTYAFRNSNYPNASDFAHKTRESMAEAGANNVFCKPGVLCDFNKIYSSTAIDYQKACKNTYAWVQANIFGGDDFFASQGSSTQGNPTSTTNTSPNNNTCNGAYTSWFHDVTTKADLQCTGIWKYGKKNGHKCAPFKHNNAPNFGDPLCEMSSSNHPITPQAKDKLYALLKQKDPLFANRWYKIIKCESGYNPNNYNSFSTSGMGAYGLFQMNPLQNGVNYDGGDTYWKDQVTRAVQSRVIFGWGHWGCKGLN